MNTRELLRQYGVRPQRRAGQRFLIDDAIARREVGYADIGEGDVVLEIGAGLGMLTQYLAQNAGKVIAIERDPRLADVLAARLPSNVQLVQGDALKIPLPAFDVVVSNLPYQISSPITFRLLNHRFKRGVLMYQREFAQRMVSPPGSSSYGRLSVELYYKADCRLLETVPKAAFYPPPRVESAIVRVVPRTKPPFPVADEPLFHTVVRALFSHRRKCARNALLASRSLFACDKTEAKRVIDKLPYGDKRAGELAPSEFGEITDALAGRLTPLLAD